MPVNCDSQMEKLSTLEKLTLNKERDSVAQSAKTKLIQKLKRSDKKSFNPTLMYRYFMVFEENGSIDASDFLEATQSPEPQIYIEALIKLQTEKMGKSFGYAVSKIISIIEVASKNCQDYEWLSNELVTLLRQNPALDLGEPVGKGDLSAKTQVLLADSLCRMIQHEQNLLLDKYFKNSAYELVYTFHFALKKEKFITRDEAKAKSKALQQPLEDFCNKCSDRLRVGSLLNEYKALGFSGRGEVVILLLHTAHIKNYSPRNVNIVEETEVAESFKAVLAKQWRDEKTQGAQRDIMNAVAQLSLYLMEENILSGSEPEAALEDDEDDIPVRAAPTRVSPATPFHVAPVRVEHHSQSSPQYSGDPNRRPYDRSEVGEILKNLRDLGKDNWIDVGSNLGLNYTKVKNLTADRIDKEVITRWINQEDYVADNGTPCKATLVAALRSSGLNGIASNFEGAVLSKDRNLVCSPSHGFNQHSSNADNSGSQGTEPNEKVISKLRGLPLKFLNFATDANILYALEREGLINDELVSYLSNCRSLLSKQDKKVALRDALCEQDELLPEGSVLSTLIKVLDHGVFYSPVVTKLKKIQ